MTVLGLAYRAVMNNKGFTAEVRGDAEKSGKTQRLFLVSSASPRTSAVRLSAVKAFRRLERI